MYKTVILTFPSFGGPGVFAEPVDDIGVPVGNVPAANIPVGITG